MPNPLAFGANHATCAGCATLFENKHLIGGRCEPCNVAKSSRREMILAKADGQTLAKLARELTASIKATNKGEPTSPKILESALERLGKAYKKPGASALGELISEQLLKATGQELTPAERETWRHSPLVIHRFAELLTRLACRNDEREVLDVSGLSEEDLLSSLTSLVHDMIETNAEYRRMAVMAGIRAQPDLIHEAMTVAGMPVVSSELETIAVPLIDDDPDDEFNAEAIGDDDED